MSDLKDTLMTHDLEAKIMFSKRYKSLMTSSTISRVSMSCSIMWGSPMIFRYNLDFGRCKQSMLSEFILLMYFSIIDKSDMLAGLFVVIMTLLFVRQMMSVIMSDLAFLRHLLMLVILELAELMINSVFDLAMGVMN